MQIIFNGKSYDSIEEMPANERQAYEQLRQMFVDANGNGIPDFMEGDMAKKIMNAFMSTSAINYGGAVYGSLEELPPDVRAKVEKAFSKLSQMGILAGMPISATADAREESAFEPAFKPSKPLIPQEPAMGEGIGGTRGLVLLLVIAAALLVCAAGAALFWFLQ